MPETNRQLLDRRIGAAWRQAAALPLWSDPVEPSDLRGGLSNVNFVVEDAGRKYVVRIGGDNEPHGVVRKNELAASRAAAAAGVAPRVVHAEPGVLVLDFIEGHTFTPEDVRNPKNLARIVDLIQRTHREIPKHLRGPGVLFWVFHVVRDYAHSLSEASSADLRQIRKLVAQSEELEKRGRADRPRLRPQRPPRRQHHRRRQAALAGRLGICRLQFAALRSRRTCLEQRAAGDICERLCCEAYFGKPVTDELRYPLRRDDGGLAAPRDDVEHGVGDPFADRFRLRQLHRGEPRPLREGLRRFQGDEARDEPPLVGQGGDRRRRHRRLLGRLSSRQDGLERRAPARARQALLGLDLARGGAGRAAPHQRQHHPAARLFGRALRPAGSGDRPRDRLEA